MPKMKINVSDLRNEIVKDKQEVCLCKLSDQARNCNPDACEVLAKNDYLERKNICYLFQLTTGYLLWVLTSEL